jgi:hypothetical protein
MGPFSERQMELYWKTVYVFCYPYLFFSLAFMEMKKVLARLIWQYDISLQQEGVPGYFHRSFSAGELYVGLTPVAKPMSNS